MPISKSPSTASLLGFFATGTDEHTQPAMRCNRMKRFIDRVYEHTCAHAIFSDIRTVLLRNGMWNDAFNDYLPSIISKCQY